MTRVKRGTIASQRRKKLKKQAKGFKWGRKNKYRAAKEALYHAWSHSFKSRKLKKRDFRRLWQIKISAGLKSQKEPISYSKFIHLLKKAEIGLDRKVLAELAQYYPEIFKEIVEKVR